MARRPSEPSRAQTHPAKTLDEILLTSAPEAWRAHVYLPAPNDETTIVDPAWENPRTIPFPGVSSAPLPYYHFEVLADYRTPRNTA